MATSEVDYLNLGGEKTLGVETGSYTVAAGTLTYDTGIQATDDFVFFWISGQWQYLGFYSNNSYTYWHQNASYVYPTVLANGNIGFITSSVLNGSASTWYVALIE